VEHRPAPDDGRVLLHEEADRHDLHAVVLERQDLAVGRDLRAPADVEHARDRVPPDVGVEDADLLALRRKRRRQVGGDRRLAHAALAGADAHDVGDLRERAGRQLAAAELLLEAGLLLVGEDVEGDVDTGHALEGADGGADGVLEVAADGAAGRGQRDGDVDRPVGARVDRPDHLELHDGATQLRVDDGGQRLEDLVTGGHGIHSGKRVAVPRAGGPDPRRMRERAARGRPALWGGEVLLCRRDM
jgi:hypothetical protein